MRTNWKNLKVCGHLEIGLKGHHAYQSVQTHHHCLVVGGGKVRGFDKFTCPFHPGIFEAESWAIWQIGEELKLYYEQAKGATQHPTTAK